MVTTGSCCPLYIPELFVDGFGFEAIEREEGLGFNSLLLHVLDAVLRGTRVVADNSVHVLAHDLGHGKMVSLVCRGAQIQHPSVL